MRAVLVVVALVCTSCIGATDRSDFQEEVRERGGGVSTVLVTVALDAVRSQRPAGVLLLRRVQVNPVESSVVATVQDPNDPGVVDRYGVRNGKVVSVEPVRLSVRDDAGSFPYSSVPLDRIEEFADGALAAFQQPDAWIESFSIELDEQSESGLRLVFNVGTPRSFGHVIVDAAGEEYEVVRQ